MKFNSDLGMYLISNYMYLPYIVSSVLNIYNLNRAHSEF